MAEKGHKTTALELKLIDSLSGPAAGARAAIASLDQSLGKMRNTKAAMESMGSAKATASGLKVALSDYAAFAARAAAPAAAAFGGQQAISKAADFEQALVEIQKKTGASAEAVAKLGEEMKALATNGELAVSIDEIAAAFERGGAAGIPLEELREFARLSAKAADAFGMTATDVGNAAAGFNKALGVPMQDMERLFDLVNGLADSGIADESGIVAFLDQAGAMSKTFGLTVDQTAALGAALANLKVPAGEAATAMNAILTKILAPNALSGDAREALGALVGDFGAFAKTIEKDADGALVGLIKKLKTLDKAKRTGIIADLFGQEHLDVMTQLVEGSEELERNLKYAAGRDWLGSLQKSYSLKLKTFWAQWQVFKNDMQELAIDAGTMSLPALKAGLVEARRIVDEVGRGLDTLKARVDLTELQAARDAVGEVATAIGDIASMGGEDTPIGTFFGRIAQAANIASGAINAAKDAAQALGLVRQDDDTDAQRTRRRDRLVDQMFDGPLGKAPKALYDLATRRENGDTFKYADEAQRRGIEQQAATRGISIEDVRAEIEAAARRRAEKTGQPYRSPFPAPLKLPKLEYPTAPPADLARKIAAPAGPALKAAPIPTPRPMDLAALTADGERAVAIASELGGRVRAALDAAGVFTPQIAAPLAEEGSKATAEATATGARIVAALSIVAKPTVDLSSISSAKAAVDALAGALRSLPASAATVRSASSPAASVMQGPPLPRRAAGGLVRQAQPYLVGERGPEVFTPGKTGNITPNHALGGGGSTTTIAPSNQYEIHVHEAFNAQKTAAAVRRELDARDRQVRRSAYRSERAGIDGRVSDAWSGNSD